ncbi:Tricetin 3-4-5-O-trimethyltransferase, partial [Nymphaea thermarum]
MDQKKSVQEKMMEIIAQANVGTLACSYMKSYSLNAVIELGIADIIHSHGQPLTASQLVAKIPTSSCGDVPRLDRLMGFLVHAGVFAEVRRLTSEGSSEISYGMTPVSRLLLRDGPQSLLSSLRLMLHPLVVSSWENLPNCFRSGEGYPTAFEAKHGEPLWTKASLDPAFNMLFNEAMSFSSKQLLVRMFDGCGQVFEGVNSLVDVGGGNGTVAAFLAYAFPNIKCMVLDLPHVVASSSPQPNVVFIAGDMFESIPQADVILLKEVLHHWDDEKCVKILKRCRESIPKPGGKVIIVDI